MSATLTRRITTADLMAEIENAGGFTYDPHADRLVIAGEATGYAIALPGTEMVIDSADELRYGITALSAYLPAGTVIGGWYSASDHVYMVELTEIFQGTRAEAIALGISRGQEAIYDLATGECIDTFGRGDRGAASYAA